MSELTAIANFVKDFGWLGVSILIMAAWMFGLFHSDREMKNQAASYDRALAERDKRFDDMKTDRDEWRAKAGTAIQGFEQLTEVMQPAQNPRRVR